MNAWRDRGRLMDIGGLEVFAVDEGPRDAQTLLFIHGFPSSSYDWRLILPQMQGRRTILLDLPGFGLSAKPQDHAYSLFEQADVIEQLMARLGVARAHVIAHDMGTTVACELLARRERGLLAFAIDSLALLNGSVHIELAHLTPSQKVLRSPLGPLFSRLSSKTTFLWQLKRILGRPVGTEELEDMWALILHRGGRAALPLTIRYLDERWRFHKRWIGALTRLDLPTLVLWGRQDPVAVPAIAQRLVEEIPGAELQWLDALGHYLQLEDPETVGRGLAKFLEGKSTERQNL